MRVFPLSNWTELDVWEYIRAENIPVVPLYFSKPRPVVKRAARSSWSMTTACRSSRASSPRMARVRFRTLGCYPLDRRHRIRG